MKGHWLFDHWGTKLVSFGVAIVLWFVVLGSRNVEETKEVPIEVVTAPDLIVSNEVADKVSFRLSGPKAFLRAVLDRREDPIRVNLTGAKAGLVTYRFFSDNLKLPIGVKVNSIQPTAVLVKLEAVRKKEVPVKIELRGVPPEGYRLTRAEVVPDRVRIRGAESRIESVAEMFTLPVELNQLRGEYEKSATFDLSRARVELDQEPPILRLRVEPIAANYRIKNIEVKVIGGIARVEPRVVTLFVRASAQDLAQLDRTRVNVSVNVSGLSQGKHQLNPKVELPAGIGLVKVSPEIVTVRIGGAP